MQVMMVEIILKLVSRLHNIQTVSYCITKYKIFIPPLKKHVLNAQHGGGALTLGIQTRKR